MRARAILLTLLAVVAGAAAVLSFSALRDLALLCGFAAELAWLLPVVVDAGAAAGSLVWLGGRAREIARRFARALALTLLGLSVAANALAHALDAYRLAPAWWVVVLVSAIAPAVLGSVVHLAVLVSRTDDVAEPLGPSEPIRTTAVAELGAVSVVCDLDGEAPAHEPDRAGELIAAGAGRRRLSRELAITEYEARRLIEAARPTASPIPVAARAGVPSLNGAPS